MRNYSKMQYAFDEFAQSLKAKWIDEVREHLYDYETLYPDGDVEIVEEYLSRIRSGFEGTFHLLREVMDGWEYAEEFCSSCDTTYENCHLRALVVIAYDLPPPMYPHPELGCGCN